MLERDVIQLESPPQGTVSVAPRPRSAGLRRGFGMHRTPRHNGERHDYDDDDNYDDDYDYGFGGRRSN